MKTTSFYYLNHLVGVYNREKNVFIKYRKESDILKIYNGLAISYRILQRLRIIGCNRIIILLTMNNGTTKKYYSTVTKYIEEGITYSKGLDYQKVLSLEQLEKDTPKQEVLQE